mgnify:CR=1 FL=1
MDKKYELLRYSYYGRNYNSISNYLCIYKFVREDIWI